MRDRGRVGVGIGPMAVDGGIHEMLHVMSDGSVDQGFALCFFCGPGLSLADGCLNGEDAPDVTELVEDGVAVVQVTFDDSDISLSHKGLSFGGRSASGKGKDTEGSDGRGRYQCVNHSAALIACGAGDKDVL